MLNTAPSNKLPLLTKVEYRIRKSTDVHHKTFESSESAIEFVRNNIGEWDYHSITMKEKEEKVE